MKNNGTVPDEVNGSINSGRIRTSARHQGRTSTDEQPDEAVQRTPVDLQWLRAIYKRFAVPLALVAVVLAILAMGGLFGRTPEAELPAARAMDVKIMMANEDSSYQVRRSYLGTIESRRNSRLSFEIGGKLIAVAADEGEYVEQGSLLATLDTKILRSKRNVVLSQIAAAQAKLDEMIAGPRIELIAAATAQVSRWDSQLTLAKLTASRLTKLRQSKSIAQQEVDDAVYDQRVVAAQLDLAKSQLAELKNGTRKEQLAAQRALVTRLNAELRTLDINIEKSRLLAPYSGIIAARRLDEGEVIASGQPVFELLDNRCLEARVGLPASLIETVTNSANPMLIYRDQKITSRLKSVRPQKNSDTRTIDVVFSIESSIQPASVGDLVRLELPETIAQTGFWIPVSALVENYRGLWGCYVADPVDSDATMAISKLRELELLHQDGELAFVRGGLNPGEHVIVSGVHRLVPDQNVKPTYSNVVIASAR